jgi:hypothetical protein
MDGLLEGVGMVSFRDVLSPDVSEAIRQYVISESQKVGTAVFMQDAGPVQ